MIKEKVRWNNGIALFVNATPADGIDCYDIWHNGGPGGHMFTAQSQEAAEEICSAIHELNELRAEAEYLRKERAAVVAWLREQRQYGTEDLLGHGFANVCGILADVIERGEHRREEKE
jgi:hypothetical protein